MPQYRASRLSSPPLGAQAHAGGLDGDDEGGSDADEADDGDERSLQLTDETPVLLDQELLEYLRTSNRSAASERVRRKAKHYYYAEGRLYKLDKRTGRHLEVLPISRRVEAIRACHDVAHPGVDKTYALLRQQYFFSRMKDHVRAYVEACAGCQAPRSVLVRPQHLNPLPIEPFNHRWHLDLAGPYPETVGGNCYIAVAVESYTKFVEVLPMPNKTAAQVARFVYTHIITRYGPPRAIHTDQGTEFQGSYAEMLREYGIMAVRSAAYSPTTNGQAERTVGLVRDSLQAAAGPERHERAGPAQLGHGDLSRAHEHKSGAASQHRRQPGAGESWCSRGEASQKH